MHGFKDRQWRRPWSYLYISWVGVPVSPREGRLQGKGTIGDESILIDDLVAFKQVHSAVFQQSTIVSPYFDEHAGMNYKDRTQTGHAWLANGIYRDHFGD